MFNDALNVFRYKELIKVLVLRDLKARYKKSILGYFWTWLDPLLTMFVFILIFGIILNMKTEYFPIYLICGLIPWMFFSSSVNGCVDVITRNAWLIKRVFFPREIFPLTLTLGHAVNMLLSFLVIVPLVLVYGLPLTLNILLLPIVVFFLFLFTLGIGMGFSCSNVYFRDMAHIVPFIIKLWFYLTPIFYAIEGRIPQKYLNIYMMANPLAVILSFFRSCLMGYSMPEIKYVVICFTACLLVFFAGYTIFKKNEDGMVKRI